MLIRIEDVIVKPYVRMTRRGKFVKKDAMEYLASKEELQTKIKSYMNNHDLSMLPSHTPLEILIFFNVPSSQGHRCDIDNLAKAVLDACNHIVFEDDRWVDDIYARRFINDHNSVKIDVRTMDPNLNPTGYAWQLEQWAKESE